MGEYLHFRHISGSFGPLAFGSLWSCQGTAMVGHGFCRLLSWLEWNDACGCSRNRSSHHVDANSDDYRLAHLHLHHYMGGSQRSSIGSNTHGIVSDHTSSRSDLCLVWFGSLPHLCNRWCILADFPLGLFGSNDWPQPIPQAQAWG